MRIEFKNVTGKQLEELIEFIDGRENICCHSHGEPAICNLDLPKDKQYSKERISQEHKAWFNPVTLISVEGSTKVPENVSLMSVTTRFSIVLEIKEGINSCKTPRKVMNRIWEILDVFPNKKRPGKKPAQAK